MGRRNQESVSKKRRVKLQTEKICSNWVSNQALISKGGPLSQQLNQSNHRAFQILGAKALRYQTYKKFQFKYTSLRWG